MKTDDRISNMQHAALPRTNGELVFKSPWEARAFGLAVALKDNGSYKWEDFARNLTKRISSNDVYDEESYYLEWLTTLEKLVVTKGLVSRKEFKEKLHTFSNEEHPGHSH